jgi:5,10-methylene-tetrahydrofolate dehydrogenase/methenyl tetrahydrofolate cyclohydrolase
MLTNTILYPLKGVVRLLEECNVQIAGKKVTVIGRSQVVGQPVAALLQNRDATVTVVHSKTDIAMAKKLSQGGLPFQVVKALQVGVLRH